jgi:hypothetical protein
MKTTIRCILTVLLAWGFVSVVIVGGDWFQTRYSHASGYWITIAATGVTLIFAAICCVLGALIWTIGDRR